MVSLETENMKYFVEKNDEKESFIINDNQDPNDKNYIYSMKNKKKISLLIYILFLSILALITSVLFYFCMNKNLNYTYEENEIIRPYISDYNYAKMTFKNGLQILLVQVGINDTAGGSIVYDTGYLDESNPFYHLDLAIENIVKGNISNHEILKDYLGSFDYATDEYYSYFSFDILNSGFFKYLDIFNNLTYLEEDDERFQKISTKISRRKLSLLSKDNLYKEKFLLDYYIYNCSNVYIDNISNISINNDSIIKMMKNLTNPKITKIVLASHFKLSLMKKKVLHYFNNIANKDKIEIKENNLHDNEYLKNNDHNFTTKKVILFSIYNDINYIRIHYYVDKDKNDNYTEFSKKLGYFRYIKYILDETGEGSLYSELTNTTKNNFTIKSLSCDFEIVMKSKIRFSIKINLAPSSYKYLDNIIKIVYQYIDYLVKNIEVIDSNKYIFNEINKILEQEFIFSEDNEKIRVFTKNLGIKLCEQRNNNEFFKEYWIENTTTLKEMNYYFSQLTLNNSVIILALTNEKIKIVEEYSIFKFGDLKNLRSVLHKAIDLNITYDECKFNLQYKKNNYISIYNTSIKNENEESSITNMNAKTLNITSLRIVRFLRETKFKLPKVEFSMNIYHPFFKPGFKNSDKDCIFFENMIYLSYIEREINKTLSDAIRAGTKFTYSYNQNGLHLSVLTFSDISYDIMSEIKKILMDREAISLIYDFENNNSFPLYMQSALEDHLNIRRTEYNQRARTLFIHNLNNNTYVVEEFPNELNNTNIFKKKCKTIFDITKEYITNYVIDLQIYGYYNETEAQKIVELFEEGPNDKEEFNSIIISAGIENNIKSENFTSWFTNFGKLEKYYQLINRTSFMFTNIFRFLFWSDYKIEDRIKLDIFLKILKDNSGGFKNFTISYQTFVNDKIYAQISLRTNDTSLNKEKLENYIKDEINKTLYNNEENYNTNIDVVGSRFYYIKNNVVNNYYARVKKLTTNSLSIFSSYFYNTSNIINDDVLKELYNWEYSSLYDSFDKVFLNPQVDILFLSRPK